MNKLTQRLLTSINVKGEVAKVLERCNRFLKTQREADGLTFQRLPIETTPAAAEELCAPLWNVPDLGRMHIYEKIWKSRTQLEAHLYTLEGLLLHGMPDTAQRRMLEAVCIRLTYHCRKELMYVLLPLARQWTISMEDSIKLEMPDLYDEESINLATFVARQNDVKQPEVLHLIEKVLLPEQPTEESFLQFRETLLRCTQPREEPKKAQVVDPPDDMKKSGQQPDVPDDSGSDEQEKDATPTIAPEVVAIAQDAERIFGATLLSHARRAERLAVLTPCIEQAGEAMRNGKARRAGDGLWYTIDIIERFEDDHHGRKQQRFSADGANTASAQLSLIHHLLESAGFTDSLAEGALEACSARLLRSFPLYVRGTHTREEALARQHISELSAKLDDQGSPAARSGKRILDRTTQTISAADALQDCSANISQFSGETGFIEPQASWPEIQTTRILEKNGSAPAWLNIRYAKDARSPVTVASGSGAESTALIEQDRVMGPIRFPNHGLAIDDVLGEGNDVTDAALALARGGTTGLHRTVTAAKGAALLEFFQTMRVAGIPLRCFRYENAGAQAPFLFLFHRDAAEHLGLIDLPPISSFLEQLPQALVGDPQAQRVLHWLPPEEKAPLTDNDINDAIRKYLTGLEKREFPLSFVEKLVQPGYVWLDRRHGGSKHPLWRGNGRSWAICGEDWQTETLTKKHLLQLFFENVGGTGSPIVDKRAFYDWLQQQEEE